MITNNETIQAEQSVSGEQNSRRFALPRRKLWGAGALLIAGVTLIFGTVHGQVTGLQIVPLAQGYSPENNLNLHVQGPSDVLQSLLVFQPGGDTGWHTHPGPVVVVVKSGALTEFHSNGCMSVHPAGSVFFETKEEVHRAVNQTGGVAEAYVTFISPTGAPPLIPASDPGQVCRK